MIVLNENGLYCPLGDFYIDPLKPVERAVITHAHGDHCRSKMRQYIAHPVTCAIARLRLSPEISTFELPYGETMAIGGVDVSLHSAGHILGSAQVRIEGEGGIWLISGDYKRQVDPSCDPFEVVTCDTFISEATFALPIFRWPKTDVTVAQIIHWWEQNREDQATSLIFAYSLGKTQRLIMEILNHSPAAAESMVLHPACEAVSQVYRDFGVKIPRLKVLGQDQSAKDCRGHLVIMPPTLEGAKVLREFKNLRMSTVSGWMTIRGNRRRQNVDQGFVISDHADWQDLLSTVRDTTATRILATHGYTDVFARHLIETGLQAEELGRLFEGETD